MTFYKVRARPRDNISELRYDIDHGMIHTLIPFGKSLQQSLENAKVDNNKNAIWIVEDNSDPPFVSEREAVLDRYFSDIQIEVIGSEQDGWNGIKNNQSLWDVYTS